MHSEQQKRIGVATLGLLVLAFVAAVVVNNSLFRGVRLDLTENQLYTLSDGTRSLLRRIEEPINLYFFFSEQDLDNDEQFLRGYARRVRDLLDEFEAESGGRITLSVIDPLPFSEDEDRASQFGLQPVSVGGIGESFYFGLAGTNSVGDEDTIPFFQPTKENFLEYDVARLIYNLANPIKKTVGLYTALPVKGGFDPRTQQPSRAWTSVDQAEQLFDIETLPETFTEVPADIDVLWIIHPTGADEQTLYAIDQFVMRGGRALIFVDPLAEVAGGAPNPVDFGGGGETSSTLEPLFGGWGIEFDPSQVVADDALALRINTGQRAIRHIGLLGLDSGAMDQDDVVTSGLQSINVGVAGTIGLAADSTLTLTPLLSSTGNSGLLPAVRFQFLQDPEELYSGFVPTPQRYTIAARISGALSSAFPDGSPTSEDSGIVDPATRADHIGSTDDANLIVVADVDLLSDRLWVQVQSFLGQQIVSAFANNGDFVVNALDNLSGSADLIGLRSRASFSRPFDRVNELRIEADARFRATEEQLQAQLSETERRLGELQASRSDNNSLLMSPEQQAELQRFLDEQVRIRQELRAVRRNLDRDIERLGTVLRIINIGLVPALLVGFLLVRFALRRSQRRSRS